MDIDLRAVQELWRTRKMASLWGRLTVLSAAVLASAVGVAASEPCPRGTRRAGSTCIALEIPENAELNYLGSDWTCRRGYRRVGNRCDELQLPMHAELNYLGNDWTCRRGYRRVGNRCDEVQLPENAELSYLGNDWTCVRGYVRRGDRCEMVRIPENAELSYLGSDWTCKRGYSRRGNRCEEVQVPANAELDITGNSWSCRLGFKRTGVGCSAMSERERLAQDLAIQRAVNKSRRVSTSTCEIDGKQATGDRAEVTIQRSGCRGYFVADGPSGNYLLEWYGGYDPSEGDVIIGRINSYGFVDVCYPGHGEGRVYVDDYLLGTARAREKLADKCR